MAWEENPRICLHMQLIAILSRIGVYKYKCSDCGHEFIGVDMELNCTAESAPVKCPKCGSLNTSVTGSLLFDMCKEACKEFFRNMWKRKKSK